MPLIQVNMAAGRTDEEKKALLSAITQAVHDSIGAPIPSIRVWIHEFPATQFMAGGEWLVDRQAKAGASS
ncbi:MAG: tautomerase family protein [Actinomycetota bacterium]|jgi:4-oxalocrotonate tautomerase|nr:tautomerase family protein [Actinomycetota bacterium]